MPVKNRVPSYRHHKARGLAVATICGKDHYLGPWKSKASYVEYDRLIAEWMANGRTLDSASDQLHTITVVEVIRLYWDHVKATYPNWKDARSIPARAKLALRKVRELYGTQPAAEFGPVKLKTVRQQFIDAGQSRLTVNQNTGFIKRMFRWAASDELIPSSVYHGLQSVEGLRKGRSQAKEGKKVRPVDRTTVDATLPHLPETVATMVELQLLLGCRPGELCDMRPVDIDRSASVWVYVPESHKTENHGHDRAICIGPKAQVILKPLLLRAETDFCFSPADSERNRLKQRHAERKTEMSCGNRPGSRCTPNRARPIGLQYTNDSYRRAITRACEKAGVKPWSPHQLRHTRANEIRSKYGLEGAQVVLGHANARITEVYAERDMQLAARVAKEVG